MGFPGYIVKEFPPTQDNPRNSEGDFIKLKDGRIAFAYSRFSGGFEDGARCELAVSFSSDNGETWSKERVFLRPQDCDGFNLMSVSLVPMQDGTVGLFYLKKYKGMQCKAFFRKTVDFTTFSDEICCFEEPGYYTVNNQRIIRQKNGNLVIVAGYTDTTIVEMTEEFSKHNYHGFPWPAGRVAVYVSSNDGQSWSRTAVLDPPFKEMCKGTDIGLQEPGVVELDDGALYMYFRNNTGRQLQSYSYDGGYTWSNIEPSRFTAPPSPMNTLKLKNGNVLIGYNPIPYFYGRQIVFNGNWTGARTPYVLEIADGNLQPLVTPRAIESDERSGFCYCALHELDDAILLGYCAGGENDKGGCLTRLRIRKILKADL